MTAERVKEAEAMGEFIASAIRSALLVERAAIRAAVENLQRDRGDDSWDTVVRSEVLAIIDTPLRDKLPRRTT